MYDGSGIPPIDEMRRETHFRRLGGLTHDDLVLAEAEVGECIRASARRGYNVTHVMVDGELLGRESADDITLDELSDIIPYLKTALLSKGYSVSEASDGSFLEIWW